jgi:hypothetical protein
VTNNGDQPEFEFLGNGETRADQIYRRFKQFHVANPIIWKLFVRFSFEVVNSGREGYGAAAVFERLRWHLNIEIRGDETVKLNNDFRAYYARMFEAKYMLGLFRMRKRRSAGVMAYGDDIPVHFDPPPGFEDKTLVEELKKLADL